MWWAGSSSPARFLVPIVFPLGVAVASAGRNRADAVRAISVTLLGVERDDCGGGRFGGDGRLAYKRVTGRARWLDWTIWLGGLRAQRGESTARRSTIAPGPVEVL